MLLYFEKFTCNFTGLIEITKLALINFFDCDISKKAIASCKCLTDRRQVNETENNICIK